MKIIQSIILAFVMVASSFSTATNRYDFSTSKTIDEQGGAWKSDETMMFFFDDGTSLYIQPKQTYVGTWKFINEDKSRLRYTINYNTGIWKDKEFGKTGIIEGDKLIVSQGDYNNYYTRILKK